MLDAVVNDAFRPKETEAYFKIKTKIAITTLRLWEVFDAKTFAAGSGLRSSTWLRLLLFLTPGHP